MRRYGERVKAKIKYKVRIGVYGVISVGNNILLTDQDEEEIQLPGGGLDPGEQKKHALVREVREETGWKIQPIKLMGTYQRFVFMPEYNLWAQKICHIYLCKGIYPLSKPLDKGHKPILTTPDVAIKLIQNEGDREYLRLYLNISLK